MNQREGMMVYSVPSVNCFLGNTSYGNHYVAADKVMKLQEIRPANNGQINQKLNAISMYQQQFANALHKSES
jgi:hypothetical protein|tara:strand:+ start:751 stop:966 length:216 start_codon:yes stop_codon:yes gene_type:complete